MADLGRREVVSDPLALNPREQQADRSLPTYGIRNPQQGPGDAATKQAMGSLSILDNLKATVGRVFEAQVEDLRVRGGLRAIAGATEAEIAKDGNKYTTQGAQAIWSANKAESWFTEQTEFLDGAGAAMDPAEYEQKLMSDMKEMTANLPDDPLVRKTFLSDWKSLSPRLMSTQVVKHNEYNTKAAMTAGSELIYSAAGNASDKSVAVMGGEFRVNTEPVEEPLEVGENDRDIGIRTMIAEAGGEGLEGMAAVAHVMINRVRDSRYPKSIQDVALQDKQFSVWNDGGSVPLKYDTNSEIYKRAAKVFDATVGGLHVDPTGGAVNYFSARGMQDLKDKGAQNNLIPAWWDAAVKESGGSVTLGGHQFAGRSNGLPAKVSATNESVAPAEQAVIDGSDPVPANTPARGSRIQKIIASLPLKDEDKATTAADAIIRALDNGDDSIFNDAGGVALLQGLNAPASLIDKVLTAKEKFDNARDKRYDGEYEKGRAAVLARVTSGEFRTMDEAIDAVTEFHAAGNGTEAEAKALSRAVSAEWNKADRQQQIPIPFRDAMAKLYDGITSGRLDASEAAVQVQTLGKQLGVKTSTVESYIGNMYTKAEAEKASDRSKAEAEFKKQQAEKDVIARAQNALTRDSGLKGLGGQVRIPDPIAPGGVQTVTGEEYGVWALKNNTLADYQKQYAKDIRDGTVSVEEVGSMAAKDVYSKLAKQQVYDVKAGRELASAVTGNLLGSDGKTVRPEALQALDFYLQMRDNPNVGTEYLNSMIENDQAKSLLETAAHYYDGETDIGTALLKASDRLNSPMDTSQQLDYNSAFYAERDKGVQQIIKTLSGRDSFFNSLFGDTAAPYDIDMAMSNTKVVESYIQQRATTFHMLNPREPMAVSVKRAADALATDGVMVGGALVFGRADRNQRLDQVMGVQDLGKLAPDKAVKQYLQDYGKMKWKELWKDDYTLYISKNDVGVDVVNMPLPAYDVSYNPQLQTLEINLFKDATRTTYIGEPMRVRAKDIGEHYIKAAKVGQTTPLKEAWRDFKEKATNEVYNNLFADH